MSKKSVAGTPVDPTIRFAKLTLDAATFQLAFDFNALAMAEEMCGINLLRAIDLTSLTARQFRGIFLAACLKVHSKMTLEQAGQLLTMSNMPKIIAAISEAWELSMPQVNPEDKQEDPPQPDAEPAK